MSCPAAGPGTVARVNLFAYRLRPGQLVALDAVAGVGYTLVLLAAALARPPGRAGWFEALVVAAIGLPVAARRRWPWPTMGVVTAATILAMALDVVREPFAATAYALYPAALRIPRHRREPTVVIAVATAVGLVGLFVAGQPPGFDADIGLIVVGVVLVGSAWTVGRAVRERREYARRYAAELAERAATEERLRIARDLHDVVSHTLSLIGIKAGVARHVADQRPEEALEALEVIETTSREALADMRRMLGALRTESGVGVSLTELADRTAAAGVPVELVVSGVEELPPDLGYDVHRIAQEALTNVVTHAAPAPCRLVVECSERGVRVEVTDDGCGARPRPRPGYGLIGMRERVARHGGIFTAGPRPEGGFAVSAWLPAKPREPANGAPPATLAEAE
jgi:signal transduction histidine kinase